MRTDAVPPRFKRNAFAALLPAAFVYPVSSYLSHPGAFPKSAGVSSYTFPNPAPGPPHSLSVFAV